MSLLALLLLPSCATGSMEQGNSPPSSATPPVIYSDMPGSRGNAAAGKSPISITWHPSEDSTTTETPQPTLSGSLLLVNDGKLLIVRGTTVEPFVPATSVKQIQQPVWSPDGTQIAFVRVEKNYSDLWIMQSDGSRQRQLTHNAGETIDESFWAFSPSWSPDGAQLLYLSNHSNSTSIDLAVCLFNLATSKISQLTTPQIGTGGDADPVWRPSPPSSFSSLTAPFRQQFVYTQFNYEHDLNNIYAQLWFVDLLNHNSLPLTPAGVNVFQPSWSPDGQFLTFIKREGEQNNLYYLPMHDLTGDVFTRAVILLHGVIAQPAWAPEGSQIAYYSQTEDGFVLRIALIKLAPNPQLQGEPVEIPTPPLLDTTSRPAWKT